MPWARFDDRRPSNRKIRRLSDGAYRLDSDGIMWCAENTTDGVIRADELLDIPGRRHKALAAELVTRGRWHEAAHDCPRCPQAPDGWVIHDYLEYNPSAEKVRAEREAKKERQERWRKKNASRDASQDESRDGTEGASRDGAPRTRGPVPSRPDPKGRDGGSVGESVQDRYARDLCDDDQKIITAIVAAVHSATGYLIGDDHATRVAKQLLDGRNVRDPAAYVAAAIHERPWDFVPADMRSPAHGTSASDAIAATMRAARGGDQP